jgi:hypothetical protein
MITRRIPAKNTPGPGVFQTRLVPGMTVALDRLLCISGAIQGDRLS